MNMSIPVGTYDMLVWVYKMNMSTTVSGKKTPEKIPLNAVEREPVPT